MALRALGIIAPVSTTTGLPATNNQPIPTKHYPCQAISFQVLRGNSDVIYICDTPTPNLVTGAGVIVELPIPSGKTVIPLYSAGNPSAVNPIQADHIYVLPAVSGEGVRVSVLVT